MLCDHSFYVCKCFVYRFIHVYSPFEYLYRGYEVWIYGCMCAWECIKCGRLTTGSCSNTRMWSCEPMRSCARIECAWSSFSVLSRSACKWIEFVKGFSIGHITSARNTNTETVYGILHRFSLGNNRLDGERERKVNKQYLCAKTEKIWNGILVMVTMNHIWIYEIQSKLPMRQWVGKLRLSRFSR